MTVTPIQQPIYDEKSEQKGAGRMVTEQYERQYGDQTINSKMVVQKTSETI